MKWKCFHTQHIWRAKTGEVGKLYIKLANQRVSTERLSWFNHDSWYKIEYQEGVRISGSQSSIFLNIRTLSCNLILHHHLVLTSPMHYLMKCPFQLQILCCKMLLIAPNGPSIMVMRFVTDIIFKSYDHCCDQEHNISPSNDTHCLIHCTDQLVSVLVVSFFFRQFLNHKQYNMTQWFWPHWPDQDLSFHKTFWFLYGKIEECME